MASVTDLTIYLTEKCNLDCSYCYIQKDFRTTLTLAQIQKIVTDFFSSPSLEQSILFLGGEPLLEYPLLKESISYIRQEERKRGKTIHLSLFTNGTLLTPEMFQFFRGTNVSITISIDGQKAANDRHRTYRGSSSFSSFDAVTERLKLLPHEQLAINMVFSPDTATSLVENVRYFAEQGFPSINFYPTLYEKWEEGSREMLEKKLWEFARFYKSLFDENQNGQPPFTIPNLNEYFHYRDAQTIHCNKLKVSSDGYYYGCDAFFQLPMVDRRSHAVGTVESGTHDYARSKKLIDAQDALRNKFPNEYEKHAEGENLFCPFNTYFFSQAMNEDQKKHLDTFFFISSTYSKVFAEIQRSLENSSRFRSLYRLNNSPESYESSDRIFS